MAFLIETIAEKLQAWMHCWGAVAFTPNRFFQAKRQPTRISVFEFFTGNYLLAYLFIFVGAILFTFFYYRERLLTHANSKLLATNVGTATALFGIFVLVGFASVFFSSLLTYGVAKLFRSPSPLTTHVNAFMHLSAIEPLAMLGTAIVVVSSGVHTNTIPMAVPISGAIIVGLARLWALVAGFFAMSYLHPLPLSRRIALYIFGFLPAFLVFNTYMLAMVSLMILLVINPNWD
jgi:hypothetical protein